MEADEEGEAGARAPPLSCLALLAALIRRAVGDVMPADDGAPAPAELRPDRETGADG